MRIEAHGLSKKFVREWIFKDLNTTFETGNPTAIIGPNGSGKSTLLQLLSGFKIPTQGEVRYFEKDNEISVEKIYSYIDTASPYMELIEEFTLNEFLNFHFKFKKLQNEVDHKGFLEKVYLQKDANKHIRHFSSGMKQRLKLGLAFFSQSKICLLDEPTSNLDKKGIEWYNEHVQEITKTKLLIICSNQPHEYSCCTEAVNLLDFKNNVG